MPPCPSYCKQCCDEYRRTYISFNSGFLGVYAQEWDCWITGSSFKGSPCCSEQLHQFPFPPVVSEGPLFSTPSPAFTICRLYCDGHSDQCEMVPHCVFELHFSNNHLFFYRKMAFLQKEHEMMNMRYI